ncbi:MAG TPA: phosphoribosyltransferase family protein [Paraburkholderia sp.]|nr:phosphoribosyltransferase family protein [Paraburkholderia sp.]
MQPAFIDRADAGRTLAKLLNHYARRDDVVVLALPRGGVPVAYEVARALAATLDVLVVRKLGVPWQSELAMGALASGGALYVDDELVRELALPQHDFDAVLAHERAELARREQLYRANSAAAAAELAGRIAIVVDDGMATGASLKAAVRALRARAPAKIVAALPVAPAGAAAKFRGDVDEFVCALTPPQFYAVGQFYADFSETSDNDVQALLARVPADDGRAPPDN